MQKDTLLGSKVFGNWTVVEFIGSGSFGSVYKIQRTDYGHTYTAAMKLISIPASTSDIEEIRSIVSDEKEVHSYLSNLVNELINEVTLMDKLKGNSNIVSYEDHLVVEKDGGFGWGIYIKMELLTSMNSYLENHYFTVADVIILGISICKALQFCNNNGIIHRDIKPQNIFISQHGYFKLGDFGIAKQLEKEILVKSKKGTVAYMAPEVYLGKPYDESVDTYSLGLVLYRLLNDNRTPFLPYHPAALTYADKENSITSRMSGLAIPPPRIAIEPLVKIIFRACAFKAEDRYKSADEMRIELEKIDLETYKNFKVSTTGTDINEASGSRLFGGDSSFVINNPKGDNILEDYSEEKTDSDNDVWGVRKSVKLTEKEEEESKNYSELFDSTHKNTREVVDNNKSNGKTADTSLDKAIETSNKIENKPKNNAIIKILKIFGIASAAIIIFMIILVMLPDSNTSNNKTAGNNTTAEKSNKSEETKNQGTNSKDASQNTTILKESEQTKQSTTQKRNGFNKVTYNDGSYYEGNFVNDKRDGKGKYIYSNGDVYDGNWKDGVKNGYGVLTYASGNIYKGNFVDGYCEDEKAILDYKNGSHFEGRYLKGKMISGTTIYSNGKYTGNFVNGEREGYGEYYYNTGDIYKGQWKSGKKNGEGSYYNAAKRNTTVGVWKDDVLQSVG